MIKSMTGFGKASAEAEGRQINVEIRSLNSKGADVNLRLSGSLRNYEAELRNEVIRLLERGKIDINVQIDNDSDQPPLEISKSRVKAYHQQLTDIAKELGLPLNDPISQILGFEDIFSSAKTDLTEKEWHEVRSAVSLAASRVNEFRIAEGGTLQKDLENRINNIFRSLEEINRLDNSRLSAIRDRIRAGVTALAGNVKIDENRFEQELVYYIEKMDINEEKVRLKSHLNYFLETLAENSSGRKLNFISQEIGREINTIGSKASDAQMQRFVVLMKDELEKIKEQSSNIL